MKPDFMYKFKILWSWSWSQN